MRIENCDLALATCRTALGVSISSSRNHLEQGALQVNLKGGYQKGYKSSIFVHVSCKIKRPEVGFVFFRSSIKYQDQDHTVAPL
jgi:hypothetical protein